MEEIDPMEEIDRRYKQRGGGEMQKLMKKTDLKKKSLLISILSAGVAFGFEDILSGTTR